VGAAEEGDLLVAAAASASGLVVGVVVGWRHGCFVLFLVDGVGEVDGGWLELDGADVES
jgi:hypothetical protein